MTPHPSVLFSPLKIRDVTFHNRIMVSPMAQYSAVDGSATDWHFAHYAQFSIGGAGCVCMEATKVAERGVGTVGDLGLWKDEQIEPIRRIARFLRRNGAVAGIQLNDNGRKAGVQRPWEGHGPLDPGATILGKARPPLLAPSPVPHLDGWPVPREMTIEEIRTVVDDFAQTARRANEAGLDVIELHGAHGYLVHQFLSPASNLRKDRYGGSLANRMRFALEITEAVRRVWPSGKPLFFRVSAQDEGGWSLDDSIVLARELKTLGVDAIDCSSGGINVRSSTASIVSRQIGFQVPFAEKIRKQANIMTVAVGLIIGPKQAEEIIADGKADLVAIGREMLYDPFWARHAAHELGVDPEFRTMPPQYGWWLQRRAKAGYA